MIKKEKIQIVRKKKVLKPSNLGWPEDWTPELDGYSQSLLYAWCTCKRQFIFYLHGYYLPAKEVSTNFGSICHEVNDKVYSKGKNPTSKQIISCIDSYCEERIAKGSVVSLQQIEIDAAKAEAVMVPYFEYYKDDFKYKKFFDIEKVFIHRYNGVTVRGKIDGKFRTKKNDKWIKEHKTKGQINEDILLLYLPLDFQNKFYVLNDEIDTGERAKGVLYNVIRNPRSKPLKNENLLAFKKKLMDTCRKNHDHYYKRWESPYSDKDMEIFCFNLDRILSEIRHYINLEVYPNTWACQNPWPCQFLKACSSDSMSSLCKREESTKERLFPELKEEKNNGSTKSTGTKRKANRKTAKRISKK